MGLKLSEYGLFRAEDDEPDRRRNRGGDLRGARPGLDSAGAAREPGRDRSWPPRAACPHLVELGRHPRRPAHAHDRERRPRHRSKRWPRPRSALGYEYIAITDHSKALAMANGLDEKRVVAFAERVRKLDQDGLGIRVFCGHRVRHSQGRLDGPGRRRAGRARSRDRQRPQLHEPGARRDDGPAAARPGMPVRARAGPPHGPPAACSARRSRSISSAWRREAARRGVLLEINASPERLDLDATLLRAAPRSAGAKFVDLHRRAPSQAPGQHALRRDHRAPRLAGGRRCREHAPHAGVC